MDATRRIHWTSLNPRDIRARNILVPVLAIFLLYLLSMHALWRWSWQSGYHAWVNCHPVADATGRSVDAWRWVESRRINLYVPDDLAATRRRNIAEGVRGLVRELGLNITVDVKPIDSRICRALEGASHPVGKAKSVDFDRFSALLLADRDHPCAEMVVAPYIIDGDNDTLGIAYFKTGTALLTEQCATAHLARHETGHLLGYHMHDAQPLHLFQHHSDQCARDGHDDGDDDGYLMTPYNDGTRLSPQSRVALLSFWRGLESRTGERYFDR